MSKSIKLSQKHGVNPCIPICFFCNEEKNEIALLGKLPNDAEAPKHALLDYEPCTNCAKSMSQGITLIGVKDKPLVPNQPPISIDNKYPTGTWCVVSENFIKNNFKEEAKEQVLKSRKCLIDDDFVKSIIDQANNADNNNERN